MYRKYTPTGTTVAGMLLSKWCVSEHGIDAVGTACIASLVHGVLCVLARRTAAVFLRWRQEILWALDFVLRLLPVCL